MANVALLRGVNVGGKNLLAMPLLVGLFEELGCTGVASYIQSGNVIFDAPARALPGLPERLQASIAERFRLSVPVLLRTAAELDALATSNPFLAEGGDPAHQHVVFLRDAPARAKVDALDPDRSPGDRFIARGREIYLSLPNGIGRSKLTNQFFDSKLATVSSTRNWRTTLKLSELARRSPR